MKFFQKKMLYGLVLLAVGSQSQSQTTFQNVLIGSGCSSICVDGKCESTCSNDSAENLSLSELEEKELNNKDFSEIVIKDMTVKIQFDAEYSVVVSEAKELMDEVKITQKGQRLTLALGENYRSIKPGSVTLKMPSIDTLIVKGNADVEFNGFKQKNMKIRMDDASDMSGSNNSIDSILLTMNKASSVDLTNTELISANVTLNDQTDASLKFSDSRESKLIAVLSGQSDLVYCGDPVVTVDSKGFSDIEKNECP